MARSNISADISENSPYYIPRHAFLTAMHYAYQYRDWKLERAKLDGLRGQQIDGMPHAPGVGHPTESIAIQKAELSDKIALIEETAEKVDPVLAPWIVKAVTDEGVTYPYLQMAYNIPCSRNTFYDRRRKFYFYLWDAMEKKLV